MKVMLVPASVRGSLGFSEAWPHPAHTACTRGRPQGEYRVFVSFNRNEDTYITLMALCDLHNEGNIGIVVIVGATGHSLKLICHTDVFGIRFEILRCGHSYELDDCFVTEHLVGPRTDRADAFDRADTVVGNQNLADDSFTSAILYILIQRWERVAGGGRIHRVTLEARLQTTKLSVLLWTHS